MFPVKVTSDLMPCNSGEDESSKQNMSWAEMNRSATWCGVFVFEPSDPYRCLRNWQMGGLKFWVGKLDLEE